MKLSNNTFLAPLAKMEVKALTSLVKETLDVQVKSKETLTCAQLWQIHKQRRSFARRVSL